MDDHQATKDVRRPIVETRSVEILSTSIRWNSVATRTAKKKACAGRNATMVIFEMATHQNGIPNGNFISGNSRLAGMFLCGI